MTHETGKSMARRLHDSRFASRWLVGDGIDIGSGDDPLSNYVSYFPLIKTVRCWDQPDGDAQTLPGLSPGSFDFVLSSHCIEHLRNPFAGLRRWVEVCKPAGHLIIVVPDEDLYEQGQWPSRFNADHKHSFNILKSASAAKPQSVSIVHLLERLAHRVAVLKIELLDAGYIYGAPLQDQSLSPACEPAIEIILRKLPYG